MTNPYILAVPDSWHPPALLDGLAGLARDPQVKTIVEIGSWLGHTSIAMAAALRDDAARVYCVDHWKGSAHGTGAVTDPLDLYLRFWGNVQAAGMTGRIVPIFERSDKASGLFDGHPIDLLFIDGDHSYEAVMADLTNWTPLVSAGGIVCGDDYQEGGPRSAFNNFFQGQTVTTLAAGRLAVVKVMSR